MRATRTPTSEGDAQRDQDDVRHPQKPARSDGAQGRVEDLGQPALGDHEGKAAAADEQGEGRHDRLDAEARDQHAVHDADGRAAEERDR